MTIDHTSRHDADPVEDALDETAAGRAAACLFRALGDPSRLAIVRHLLLGEHNVTTLTRHVGLAQSTVSRHLACLRECGLVESRPAGRASIISLAHPEPVRRLLAEAELLLAATGDAVTLCPQVGEAIPVTASAGAVST